MKNMKRWIVLTVMFLFVANVFADNRKKDETVQKLDEEASEEFDYSFMEGVRNNLIGNFKDALGWFRHCLGIVWKYNLRARLRSTRLQIF